MFSWLRSFFRKSDVVKPLELNLADVASWLDSLRQERLSALEAPFNDCLASVRDGISRLRSSVGVLRSAELMNPAIPERAKQVMEGNREELARRALAFADGVVLPTSVLGSPGFVTSVRSGIASFADGSMRPLAVLQEFFAQESKAVASCISDVERAVTSFQELLVGSNILSHESLLADLEKFSGVVSRQKKVSDDLRAARDDVALREQSVSRAQELVGAIEREEDFAIFSNIKGRIQELQQVKRAIRQEVRDWFGPLADVLRSCASDRSKASIVDPYLADAGAALVNDTSLAIIRVLEYAGERARSGALDVREKRREKTLSHLENLSVLGGFQSRYAAAVREEGVLLEKLRGLGVTTRLVEQKRRLHEAEIALADSKTILHSLEKQVVDVSKEGAGFQERLSAYAGRQVILAH